MVVRRPWILGPCLLLWVGVFDSPAAAQPRQTTHRSNVQKAAGLRNAPKYVSSNNTRKPRLGTYDYRRYSGIVTRPEQIRSLLTTNTRYGRTQAKELKPTPVKMILDRRNLLTVRSPLARVTSSMVGRTDYLLNEETGEMRGNYETFLETIPDVQISSLRGDDGSYQDALEARLRASADEYYLKAVDAFSKRQFIQAKNFFGLVKDIEPEKTRAFLGAALVSVQKSDYLQAHGNLLRAMDLMSSLDDLRIDTNQFYKSPEDFRRRVESLNLLAQRSRESEAAQLLLSYYSWLNGDVGTAIDSAANAEKLSKGVLVDLIKRYRELLIQQRSGTKPVS